MRGPSCWVKNAPTTESFVAIIINDQSRLAISLSEQHLFLALLLLDGERPALTVGGWSSLAAISRLIP